MPRVSKPAPLTKTAYLEFRDRYLPTTVKTIFVLESPPASGLYFYNPTGSTSEPLFRAMMRDVLEIKPISKEEGLKEFAARGYLLIDATYKPVNRRQDKARDAIILRDFPLLLAELREYASPETGIVLVKANVCELLEPKLKEAGFNLLNQGVRIPFPDHWHEKRFRETVRKALGLALGVTFPNLYRHGELK
jgi:hypothetical protein